MFRTVSHPGSTERERWEAPQPSKGKGGLPVRLGEVQGGGPQFWKWVRAEGATPGYLNQLLCVLLGSSLKAVEGSGPQSHRAGKKETNVYNAWTPKPCCQPTPSTLH